MSATAFNCSTLPGQPVIPGKNQHRTRTPTAFPEWAGLDLAQTDIALVNARARCSAPGTFISPEGNRRLIRLGSTRFFRRNRKNRVKFRLSSSIPTARIVPIHGSRMSAGNPAASRNLLAITCFTLPAVS